MPGAMTSLKDECDNSIGGLTGESILASLAIWLLCAVWIPSSTVAVLLLARVSDWYLPSAISSCVLLALLWHGLFHPLPRRRQLLLLAVVLIFVLASAVVSVCFYDTMKDSRGYHADAILALLHGVNPTYQQITSIYSPLWDNHYPKATWYFAALVTHIFKSYQLGKIYNFLLIFACFACAGSFFRRLGLRGGALWMTAAAVAFGPVAVEQMMTFYTDGAMASLLALIVMTAVSMSFFPACFDRRIFVLAASLAIAIKFTGGLYVAVVAILLILVRLLLKKDTGAKLLRALRGDMASGLAIVCLGVLVLGYSPYVTNLRQGLNPLYPVAGKDKIDILQKGAGSTPDALIARSQNRFGRFFISFFGRSSAFIDAPVEMKIPFAVSKREVINLGAADTRIGGWGVLFSGISLASLALFVWAKGWRGNGPALMGIALVLASSFSNPACWWARYTPQIALLPVFLFVPGLRAASGRRRVAAQAICALLVVNNLLIAGAASAASLIRTEKLNRSFETIAREGGQGDYWAYGAAGENVHYDQFSGLKGIVICGQRGPVQAPYPKGGFPVTVNVRNQTEVVLYKGSCLSPPPY